MICHRSEYLLPVSFQEWILCNQMYMLPVIIAKRIIVSCVCGIDVVFQFVD